MKLRWAFLIFVAGLGAGWLIPHGAPHESPAAAVRKPAAPVVRNHEARPAKTAHESKWRTFAKELSTLSHEDKETFKKSLAPGDRAAAIEALLAQTGPDGIPMDTRSMLGDILKAWASEDFDGAWAWCERVESDASRKFIASQLLEELADKDPDRALARHLEMVTEDPNFTSRVPLKFLDKESSKDAGAFLDLLGKLPFGGGCTGTSMNFAMDFSFQQAADGLTALMKSQPGKSPPVFPTNFLSTWAARDPDAAYAWFSKSPDMPFVDFGSLLEGIEKQGVPGASSTWAADKINEPDGPREKIIRSLGQIPDSARATTINGIAQAMPDAASRDRFLGDVITMSSAFSNSPANDFGFALNQMSTPEARLDALRRLAEHRRLDTAKIPDTRLQSWGLTRQQIEQAARR